MLAGVLVHQWLTFGVRAAYEVALAALVFGIAGLAGLGLELAHHKTAAGAVRIELAVGAFGAEAGVAGAGFEESQLLVLLDFVGRHRGAPLVAGQLLCVGGVGTGHFGIPILAGLWESRAGLGLRHSGGTKTQNAQ